DCPYTGGSILASLASAPAAVWDAAFPSAESPNTSWALVLGLATILVLLLWRPLVPKRLKLIPAPFVAVVVTALLLPFVPVALKTVPPLTDFAGTLRQGLAWPAPDLLWSLFDWKLLEYTLTVAFIASAETMLCATAVDQMHTGPRARYDRELWAQGLGNM